MNHRVDLQMAVETDI